MISVSLAWLAPCCFALPLGNTATATAVPTQLEFPFVHERLAPIGPVHVMPRPDQVEVLTTLDEVLLTAVPLPDGTTAALDLRRLDHERLGFGVHIDGEPAPGALHPLALSVWKGKVEGDASSEVALSFSNAGTYGWIRTAGKLHHLSSKAGPGNDWTRYEATLMTSAQARTRGARAMVPCVTEEVSGTVQRTLSSVSPGTSSGNSLELGPVGLFEVSLAVETDHQYFQIFGDTSAALSYMTALLTWVSATYEAQVQTMLTVPYMNLYTTPVDPWQAQDLGGNCIDVLLEFQDAWRGQVPFGADIGHFLSGASLGCGVGFRPGLCQPGFNFSVSGNQNGQTPFPPSPNAANLDFIVVAHELGHNFSAIHTHSYCPPLDECAPDGFFGSCQTQEVCTFGTIMSYCHLCGGFENIDTQFHPQSAADMLAYVQTAPCPETFCDAGDGSLASCPCGNTGDPDTGCDLQQGTGGVQIGVARQQTTPQNRATFIGNGFPSATSPTALVIRSTGLDAATPVVFGDGLRCVSVPIVRLGATFASGGLSEHTLGHGAAVGSGTFYYQVWLRNTPAGFCTPDAFNLSNGTTLTW
jgi:hypothetical protein